MKLKLFSYNVLDTPIHRLSGLTKLICFLLLTFAVMYSYDIRFILFVTVFSIVILKISKIKFSQIRLMIIYVVIFIAVNFVLTFLFAPEYGVEIYGTRHELLRISGRYNVTIEQLFYQITKVFKYGSVIPLGIIFLLTTNPSEFAASLNGVGVPYKVAYAVSLTLRYFPEIQRDYQNISQAQQARGLEMSKKAKFMTRFKNSLMIIIPLIFSTLERIEYISNAMDLRGFGKLKKRSWYSKKKLTVHDYIAILLAVVIFTASILISVFINGSRFYNPFI
ncbi:cobalt transport family protein [Thermoclostridium stercorarium subsp. stercorarium DSM 8532]|uniref:Cobalt transport family protein n=1 Tax=Thermoclostridium stercorarium (strain ATCC 35414 / DSM 8532 / NCIMB 11754) TaxID=1121335 RepID=L7VR37_THES1|nr:energy-coupling factor transporter transmembrane component T [Thermoclostridium stercorarium]AGC69252.1 cobalt transport family protein [Thermoclostridium stercorarium subsp. stercorarium DSM 8532]AGI40221.1 ABC transporter permease subunit [Thermoclostridium stercorarium subsp. stercorarium DSM 8532]